ncbi:MAG: hypothetical protein KDB01_18650 [Planctomycetaceae bacterium]|nr:hypothetical protein [Planctomycetaceae bacterium]
MRPTISWDALSGAVTYDVWINDITQGVSQYIRNTNLNETSFTPSSDMPMGTYIAWVRGIDADGSPGSWSGAIKYQTLQAPTDFSFTHGFIPPVLTPVADEGDAGHFERRWPQNFSPPLEHHDAASHDSVMEEFVRFDFTR